MKSEPNVGDNGVHASASPFEAFRVCSGIVVGPIGSRIEDLEGLRFLFDVGLPGVPKAPKP